MVYANEQLLLLDLMIIYSHGCEEKKGFVQYNCYVVETKLDKMSGCMTPKFTYQEQS